MSEKKFPTGIVSAILLIAAAGIFIAYHSFKLKDDPQHKQAFQLPTASEIFHLRSECAKLGQKILDDNFIGSALTQSQVSHYNPQTNRCYVDLTINTADLSISPIGDNRYILHRVLYDGQTGEMLANSEIKNEQKSGMIFDQSYNPPESQNPGKDAFFDNANDYMNQMMADNRQQ